MTVQLMMLPGDPGVPQLPVSLKTENGNSVNVSNPLLLSLIKELPLFMTTFSQNDILLRMEAIGISTVTFTK